MQKESMFAIFELDRLEKKFAKSVIAGVTAAYNMVLLKSIFTSANFYQVQCSGSFPLLQQQAHVFWAALPPGRKGCFCREEGNGRVRKQVEMHT